MTHHRARFPFAPASSAACLALGLLAGPSAVAALSFDVSFDDPGRSYGSFYDGIRSNMLAAGSDWGRHFDSRSFDAGLEVQVRFASVPTATGASATSSFVGRAGGIDVFEQGAAYELKSGIDPNGAAPDVIITLGTDGYLQNELWFDPSPGRPAVVPATQTDARSVFRHEFGHAFGFNGFRDYTSGELFGSYQSTFDALVVRGAAPGELYFNGAHAVGLYGRPVPLTFANYLHVGNAGGLPGGDLVGDLMNGVVYNRGTRYEIGSLDLAMMKDVGLPVSAVPEPQSYALMLFGLVALGAVARRRRAGGGSSPD